MKKIILTILALFLIFINSSANSAQTTVVKDYKIPAKDNFLIKASLITPKVKGKTEFKTVVLLHSLGYNSQWWSDLPSELISRGYAVLTIDLRGHGGSIYNKNLSKVSWKSMTNSAYEKCPDDIISVINYIKEENPKKVFFNDWAMVGADLGASAGILAADKLPIKPKTVIILSPVVKTKGLYIPVAIAQLDNVDFLSVTGNGDLVSKEAESYIRKFSQAGFTDYTSEASTTGMMLLKNDPELSKVITEWISQYLGE